MGWGTRQVTPVAALERRVDAIEARVAAIEGRIEALEQLLAYEIATWEHTRASLGEFLDHATEVLAAIEDEGEDDPPRPARRRPH